MTTEKTSDLNQFLEALGHDEEPMGMFYTDIEPEKGLAPRPHYLPTLSDEAAGKLDWALFHKSWSCVLGTLRRARKRRTAAYFERGRYGCLGAAFFLGFNKPQLESVVKYVSTGIPGVLEGERYVPSPELLRRYNEILDPEPAPKRFCVFKPLSVFGPDEEPEFVNFFARPEVISGLHQLVLFAVDDLEAVMSPWSAGCGNLVAWPRKYKREGRLKACLGGWDPSCRKFLKIDEITFTLPIEMFRLILERWQESFLTTKTWQSVKRRIIESADVWWRPD
ncbi:MAG: DUF169 domain-containing protein [Desulfomonile sp.]|nr:DUF169 domain-containing protein [Desulfomonile sp.]